MIDALVKSTKFVGLNLESIKPPLENSEYELATPLLTPITKEDVKIYLWDTETAKKQSIPLVCGGFFYGIRLCDDALVSCAMPNFGAFSEQVLIPRELKPLEIPQTFPSAITFHYSDFERAFDLLLRDQHATVLLSWAEPESLSKAV